nr:TolC family protein [uncultured Holophaga sp.]
MGCIRARHLWPLGLLLSPTILGAQTPQASLTLREAIQRALEQNPQVQQSLLALAASGEDRKMAAAALLPQVSASAMTVRNKYNLHAQMGMAVDSFPQEVGPYHWTQAGLEAQATLFDLSTWERWRAARHAEDSAKADTRTTREEVAALVVGSYLQGLRADASVKASRSRIELAQALEKLAENQQQQGIGTKLDTLRAQVRLQAERQTLIQAEVQARTARLALVRLLGLEPGTQLELKDTLATPDLPREDADTAYRQSLESRPELQSLEARQKAADALKASASGLRLPTVVASGSYGATAFQGESSTHTYSLGLSVKVPLFTGGLVSARIAKAEAELNQVKEARRDLEARVGYEVRTARMEVEAARNEVAVADQAAGLAEEALVQARHRFEAGVSNNIELINAQDDLAKANENQIGALYRLNQYRADLAKAEGRLETLFAR